MAYYPVIANTDYSPRDTSMAYNEPRDDFCGSFAYSEPEFGMIDPQFIPHVGFNSMPPAVDGWSTPSNTPFGGIGNLCNAFTTTELSEMRTSRQAPPSKSYHDNTESIPAHSRHSSRLEPLSPSSYGHGSPYSEDMQHLSEEEVVVPRKRGRPRLSREPSDAVYKSPEPRNARRTTCLPHKQVERKYREGLNMEFERLRRAIPTLPQSVDANVMGAAKPSKGMVLGAAIEYINKLERERDAAYDELERIGGTVRISRLEKSRRKINDV
jgi:hypothetical protein